MPYCGTPVPKGKFCGSPIKDKTDDALTKL